MFESLIALGPVGAFVARHWDVLGFYVLVAVLLYAFRRKLEFQGIVALFKTQFGVKFMTETGKKYPRFWHVIGLLAIIVGFIGMAFIVGYLFYGLYTLAFVPDAPPALSPVIPGVKIPGVPITFPLWYTLGALFFAIIVHEAMHGIMASAYGVKIKSSGFAFLGPIPGAFVEPDEETMGKRSRRQQLGIIPAGPFANVVLAFVMLGLFIGAATLGAQLLETDGVSYSAVQNASGAKIAGMQPNMTITAIDGQAIEDIVGLSAALDAKKPGEEILVTADNRQFRVVLGENPDMKGKAFMGVLGVETKTHLKNERMNWLYELILVVINLFRWTVVISLGIGIANLLPLFMVDGGRMALLGLEHFIEEKKAKLIWTRGGFFVLAIVIVLVFIPILRAIF